MSILDFADHEERKQLMMEKLVELDCEEYLHQLSGDQISDMTETMVQMVEMINEEVDPQLRLNIALNYILVLWAEMIVDFGKDSKLL